MDRGEPVVREWVELLDAAYSLGSDGEDEQDAVACQMLSSQGT
jgi:hypothetical protein